MQDYQLFEEAGREVAIRLAGRCRGFGYLSGNRAANAKRWILIDARLAVDTMENKVKCNRPQNASVRTVSQFQNTDASHEDSDAARACQRINRCGTCQ